MDVKYKWSVEELVEMHIALDMKNNMEEEMHHQMAKKFKK